MVGEEAEAGFLLQILYIDICFILSQSNMIVVRDSLILYYLISAWDYQDNMITVKDMTDIVRLMVGEEAEAGFLFHILCIYHMFILYYLISG